MAGYMITLRTPDDGDDPGPARYVKLGDAAAPDTDMDVARWQAEIIARFPREVPGSATRTGDIVVFVHGFNEDYRSARSAHLDYEQKLAAAGFTGVLISFDWPSAGLTFAYLSDRAHARLAANALVTCGIALLRDAQMDGCTVNLHVMAHSMGCFVTQQAFTWSYQDVPPDWRIGQILLVAADVDQSVFEADNPSAKAFAAHAGRLTAYCDRYDKALAISNAKRLGLAPRMGRVGLPDDSPDFMCEVDCSDLFKAVDPGLEDLLSPVKTHCFYFDQPVFWQDVVLTLAGGIDRSAIPTRDDTLAIDRFDLKTAPLNDADYAKALAQASQSPSFILPGA